jgi:hypothetical protein
MFRARRRGSRRKQHRRPLDEPCFAEHDGNRGRGDHEAQDSTPQQLIETRSFRAVVLAGLMRSKLRYVLLPAVLLGATLGPGRSIPGTRSTSTSLQPSNILTPLAT